MVVALRREAQSAEAGVGQAVVIRLAPAHHADAIEADLPDVAVRAPVAPLPAGRGTTLSVARTRHGKAHPAYATAVVLRSGHAVLAHAHGVVSAFGRDAPPLEARPTATTVGVGRAHALAAFRVDARLSFGARAREDVTSLTPRRWAPGARTLTRAGADPEEHREKQRSQVPHGHEWYARNSCKGRLKVGFCPMLPRPRYPR
jgi:hypothetical protein